MRVVFMGTPEFAVPSLLAVAGSHDVAAAYTRPDAASGRGSASRPSPVKTAALGLGIDVCQPSTLRDADAIAALEALAPDLIVVAAYGLILPQAVLDIPSFGAVNVHASLLPRWRGAAPIQRAILAGDDVTGVSIMRVEAGLDTGPYCLQRSTPVADKTAAALTEELALLGASALLEALPSIAGGSAEWTAQDEAAVTYAEKVSKDDVAVAPDLPASQIVARVRASLRSSPCRARVADRAVTLVQASLATEPVASGAIAVTRDGVLLGGEDGAVLLTRVKPDGKAEMAAADWARGVPGIAGSTWARLR